MKKTSRDDQPEKNQEGNMKNEKKSKNYMQILYTQEERAFLVGIRKTWKETDHNDVVQLLQESNLARARRITPGETEQLLPKVEAAAKILAAMGETAFAEVHERLAEDVDKVIELDRFNAAYPIHNA